MVYYKILISLNSPTNISYLLYYRYLMVILLEFTPTRLFHTLGFRGYFMYIAMNRFKIKQGEEARFIDIWRDRDSQLKQVPGFIRFHLLQGATQEGYTLFASHAEWASEEAFQDWTKSEAFRKAHANAGANRDIYLGPPQLECFNAVL